MASPLTSITDRDHAFARLTTQIDRQPLASRAVDPEPMPAEEGSSREFVAASDEWVLAELKEHNAKRRRTL